MKGTTDIALDLSNRKMYWIGSAYTKIYRVNLDGTNVTYIHTDLDPIGGIALDTEGVQDVGPDINKLTTTWANVKVQ